jgi:sterol desaturase/sphingolipid hydroxylase (fatty acid hydroxylase superfamily)
VKSLLHFETRKQPVAGRNVFYGRLLRNGLWGAGVILVSLAAGMAGYSGCEGMSWLDSFVNAAMILSGMGPVSPLNTACGKLFAGWYAIYSGIVLIGVAGLVFAPVYHRLLHRFHVDERL